MLRFIATFLTNWHITPWQHNTGINRYKFWNSYLVCAIHHCFPACLVHNFRCQWYTVDIYCSMLSTGCNPHVHGWRPQPCVSSRQLDRRQMSCCDSYCHSWWNVAFNWRMFCTGGSRACIRWPNMSQICSMGFKSGLMAGQGTAVTASLCRRLLLLNGEAWHCHPYTQAL